MARPEQSDDVQKERHKMIQEAYAHLAARLKPLRPAIEQLTDELLVHRTVLGGRVNEILDRVKAEL